jgi:hypothetical protein
MSDKNEVSVKILEVIEVSFSMKPLPENINEVEFGKNLQYGLGFSLSIDHKSNKFRIRTLVNYSVNDVNDIKVSSEVDVVFLVKNLNKVVRLDKQTKKMDIQNEFLATLIGVCIGTVRGVLSTKTKGTPFAKAPLPIINSKDIVLKMKDTQIS